MKKEDLKDFENRLLDDIFEKAKERKEKSNQVFISLYKSSHNTVYLSEFMPAYISYIGKEKLENILFSAYIKLFLNKSFYTKDKEDLNYFRNFTIIEGYPLFIFYLEHLSSTDGIIGFIYWDESLNKFDINLLKNRDNSYCLINLEKKYTKSEISLKEQNKSKFIDSLKYFIEIKNNFSIEGTLTEKFDEFLSIVLNLNENYKDMIEPLGLEILEEIKNIENKS